MWAFSFFSCYVCCWNFISFTNTALINMSYISGGPVFKMLIRIWQYYYFFFVFWDYDTVTLMCNIDVKCPYHRAGTRAASDVIIAIAHWTPRHIATPQIKRYTVKVWSFSHEGHTVYMCAVGWPSLSLSAHPSTSSGEIYMTLSYKVLCLNYVGHCPCLMCIWYSVFWELSHLCLQLIGCQITDFFCYFYFWWDHWQWWNSGFFEYWTFLLTTRPLLCKYNENQLSENGSRANFQNFVYIKYISENRQCQT
jgi:hypothetical protein